MLLIIFWKSSSWAPFAAQIHSHFIIVLTAALLLGACSNMDNPADAKGTFNAEQNSQDLKDELSALEKEDLRQALLEMADTTLKDFYDLDPSLKDKVDQAYGYALFDDHIFNIVFYVAGYGSGVAYKNTEAPPLKPVYMVKLRAGTGPGIGYAKHRQLLVIENETTFDLMMTAGLDVQASANATFKIAGFGGSLLYGDSLNPYLDIYTITDKGIDIQANWGAVEYIKDWTLNADDDDDALEKEEVSAK